MTATLMFAVSMLWSSVVLAQDSVPVINLDLKMRAIDADVLFKKEPYDRSTFAVSLFDDEGNKVTGRIAVKGSFTRNFDKKSLKIKLGKDQKWRGQKRIVLNAMATDLSMMREWLAWDLIHSLDMAAPKVSYVRLSINRRYIGMFLHIEWLDAKLLGRYNLGRDGEFFHPRDSSFCGDFNLASMSNPERCWFKLSPGDGDFTMLKRLSEQLDSVQVEDFDSYLEEHFDVESVVNWIVTNVITSNGDTYNKNYFIYFSREQERWVIIPWDYDLSFGRNWDEFQKYPANILNDNFQYYYPLELGLPNPLKDKLLKNKVLRERVINKLRGVMGMPVEDDSGAPVWFTPEVMHDKIDALIAVLSNDLHRERYTNTSNPKLLKHARALKDYATFRYNFLRKTVLQATDWVADKASVTVKKAGDVTALVDGFGYTLATVQATSLNSEANISVEVEKKTVPAFIPEGVNANRCVKRTWFLFDRTPSSSLKIDLSLQYIQETIRNNELGKKMNDENRLLLWVYDYDKWAQLPTSVNDVSNVIETKDLAIKAGRLYRFVACQN